METKSVTFDEKPEQFIMLSLTNFFLYYTYHNFKNKEKKVLAHFC